MFGHGDNVSLADVQRRGEKVLNVAQQIYEFGMNSSENYIKATLSVNKSGDLVEQIIDNTKYAVQTYLVTANKELTSYKVSLNGFPDGTKILNSSNIETSNMQNSKMKIAIPTKSITTNLTGYINITDAEIKSYPIFYANSNNDSTQNYVIADPSEMASAYTLLNIDAYKSTLRIIKSDEENKPVKGAVFNLKCEDGTNIGDYTTDANGTITISKLKQGNVIVKEVSVPEKYILDSSSKYVNLEYNSTTNLNVTNNLKRGNLKVIKVDKDNNETRIPGVEFEILNLNNVSFGTYITDKNGEIYIENLPIGEYKVRETKENALYYPLEKDITIKIEHNKTTTQKIENEKLKGRIRIVKVDEEHHEIKLSNVKFEIINSDNKVVETLITNSNGEATTSRLTCGEYRIREVETNEKYILNEQNKRVTITKDTTTEVILENLHKKGNVKVFKVDKDNNKIALGNVKFDLYSEEFGKVINSYVTDTNGEIYIENLRIGNYKLIEKNTNKWYNLADDTEIKVDWDTTINTIIENELKKSQIKVIKVDKENNEVKLKDVVFEVLDDRGNVLEKIVTDKNGEAITKKYSVRDYEKLILREIENNKYYILNTESRTITLEANQIKTIKFENEKKKGQIKVIKVDLDNNEVKIPNVEFEVLNQEGKVVDKLITDANGEAVSKRLPIDEQYTIRETKTLEEYVLTEETQIVTLQQDQITDVKFENEKKKGQIEVYKLDAENKEIKLEGVEFQVINSNGEVLETIRTNKDGYAITSRIPIGEYKFKEAKTDTMHILNDKVVKVDVTTDIVSSLEITNERIKGQIKIVKTSKDDNFINGEKAGTPIANVKFEIYDSNKNKVDEIITNEEGIAITKKLDKGKYTIKEVESGKWYLLNEEEFAAKINTNNEIVEVNVTNESEMPNVDIEKEGIIQTTANQEIRYDFKIKNTGNVPLDHFTWFDYLPSDDVKMQKLITGTYNQDLNYSIYYKTNLNDYKLLVENLNTQTNNYIDFSNIQLEEGEVITEFKADFGTVDVNFESIINPYIFVIVNSTVENDDIFTNKTRIEGDNKSYLVWDEDEHTTKVYEKKLEVKKLPRTGC